MSDQHQDKPANLMTRLPLGANSVYADGVSDVIYGVYTSKIVFAVETGTNTAYSPVQVVTLPTSALFQIINKIMQDLSQDAIVDQTEASMKEHIKSLRTLRALRQENTEN